MTAEEILNCKSCMELFPNLQQTEKLYISLMKQYHPDISDNPLCNEISAVITTLYSRIKKSPVLKYKTVDNYKFSYLREYEREDGYMYYCGNSVIYITDGVEDAVLNNIYNNHLKAEKDVPIKVLENMPYALPEIIEILKLKSGALFIRIKLEEDEVPLDELIEFYGKDIDAKHCAWIISRLLGICCFAHLGNNVLQCICTSNFFVSPSNHTLKLTGGWWFMTKVNEKIFGVQSEVYENLHSSKTAKFSTDLECIKAVCRKIFPKNTPETMKEYSESLCMGNVFEEFENWEKVIYKSFGGRFFTEMKLIPADIYNN